MVSTAVLLALGALAFAQGASACSTDADCVGLGYTLPDYFGFCQNGICVSGCAVPWLSSCAKGNARPECVNFVASTSHCGGCYRSCQSGGGCTQGICDSGQVACPSACSYATLSPPYLYNAPAPNLPISSDGTCGPAKGTRCPAGQCCGAGNTCGSECAAPSCQLYYGSCIGLPPQPNPCPTSAPLQLVTNAGGKYIWSYAATDGLTGAQTRYLCQGCINEGVDTVWDATRSVCAPAGAGSPPTSPPVDPLTSAAAPPPSSPTAPSASSSAATGAATAPASEATAGPTRSAPTAYASSSTTPVSTTSPVAASASASPSASPVASSDPATAPKSAADRRWARLGDWLAAGLVAAAAVMAVAA